MFRVIVGLIAGPASHMGCRGTSSERDPFGDIDGRAMLQAGSTIH